MEDPTSGDAEEPDATFRDATGRDATGRDATVQDDGDIGGEYEPKRTEPRPDAPPISARTELPFGLVFFLILSLAVVVFAVQNTQDVQLQFLGWEGRFPLAVVIIAVVVISVILDEILGLVLRRRRRKRLAERRELERLRQLNS